MTTSSARSDPSSQLVDTLVNVAAVAPKWPYFDEMPPSRSEMQHSLVENDAFFRLLGVTLRDLDRDTASLAVSFRPELSQPTGILHGGLYCILADSAIAQALLTTLHPAFAVVTVHLDTKYFAPVASGEVIARARMVHKGRRIAHGEAEVSNGEGTALAHAWGVFAVKPFA